MRVEVLYSFFCLQSCQLPSRASSGLKWILMGVLTRLFQKIYVIKHNNDAVLWCSNMSNQITENTILSLMIGLSIYLMFLWTFCNPWLCMVHCLKVLHPNSIFRVWSTNPLQAWKSGFNMFVFFFFTKTNSSLKLCQLQWIWKCSQSKKKA